MENIYSPAWTYNYTNGGQNNGTVLSNAYNVLQYQGAMLWNDMPHSATSSSTYSFALPTDLTKMTEALHYRAGIKTCDATSTSNINAIKQQLADGHVAVVRTNSSSWVIEKNDDGEYFILCNAGEGGHAVTVVGYDDEIEITVNGVTLTGAFKIANSWGDQWRNNGYIWVSYDALNATSAYGTAWQNGLQTQYLDTYSVSNRKPIFAANNTFAFINVYECNVPFVACVEYYSTDPYDVELYADPGTSISTSRKWGCDLGDEFTIAVTPTHYMVFDFFRLTSGGYTGDNIYLNNYLPTSQWTTKIVDESGTEATRIRTTIKDNLGNVITAAGYTALSNGTASQTLTAYLARGRVTAYDSNPITTADSQMILNYIVESIDLSNLQLLLADYNSDGVVTMKDVTAMNTDIAARNGQTYSLTDEVEGWGCSLADVIEDEYNMPIEQYIAENYTELSAMNVIPPELDPELPTA